MEKVKKEVDYSVLPFVHILNILKFHQCKLKRDAKYSLFDFYGVFKKDYSRKVFLMFSSFYPTLLYQVEHLPFRDIVNLDFHEEKRWNKNAFPIPWTYLRIMERVESLERVFFDSRDFEELSKKKKLKKLAFEVKFIDNNVMKCINSLKLKFLTIYAQSETKSEIDFDGCSKLRKLMLYRHCLSSKMFLEKNNTFENLSVLGIFSSEISTLQMDRILSLDLKKIKLYACKLPDCFYKIFLKKNSKLTKLDISHTQQFKVELLKDVTNVPKSLKWLGLKKIEEIPIEFLMVLVKRLSEKDGLVHLDLEGCLLSEDNTEFIIETEFLEEYDVNDQKEINLSRNYDLKKEDIKKFFSTKNVTCTI